jgi:hypothetical protein
VHVLASESGRASYRWVRDRPIAASSPRESGRAHGNVFIGYFECADEHVATFDRVCAALRDEQQNPEWRFVEEGPEWRGRRVLRW